MKLELIGRGSFGIVFVLSGRPVAFKHVISSEQTPELKAEFEALCSFYDSCNTHSIFAITRPLAYYDPAVSTSFVTPVNLPIPTGWPRARLPLVAEPEFRALKLDNAAYAMEQVLPLPLVAALAIRTLFYPPGQDKAALPSLCRLYFGKVIETTYVDGRPIRFFNSANFPLDVARYRKLLENARFVDDYPTVEAVASGMGKTLSCLHWHVGYDARDVEFVMGGASFSGIALNVIDFNQMGPWSRGKNQVHLLVEAFFTNDPYYPRPRPEDPLYQKFSLGYLESCPTDHKESAEAFLHAIEAEQAKRDTNFAPQ